MAVETAGNKKLWQDVLKLRETLCIHFQKHQDIKTLIVGKKFRRKNSFKQNQWHDNFSHIAGGVKRAHEDEPRDDMMDTW